MKQFKVTGMSCAACQARVEKAVSNIEGVDTCSVSLLTNSMGVEGTADSAAIIKAVEDAGYGASLKGGADKDSTASRRSYSAVIAEQEDSLIDRETPRLRNRLIASLVFLLVLMYFSMGHMMFGWPLPVFFKDNHVAMGMMQLLLAGIIMVINQKFFVSGFKSLFHLAPNMDTLIALGSSVAYGYSCVMLFMMSRAQVDGGSEAAAAYMDEFYFESAAMILTLITVGKMLEAYSKGKTTNALKGLLSLAPKTANILRNGEEINVPIDEVAIGDLFVVRPGESIPTDGRITEGSTAVNEASLTGESIPVDKTAGDEVSSATVNLTGFITCEATRVGEDTTLSQIIRMVSDAAATKAPVAKLADRISGVFVPIVIALGIITTLIWLFIGAETGYALARGITVLVVSCPCALGLATPVAIMVGNGMGARHGILFKTAEALQETGNVRIVALDKTGTITEGRPRLTDLKPAGGVSEDELLAAAYALEKKSEHPLALAVVEYTESLRDKVVGGPADDKTLTLSDFSIYPGNGLMGQTADGKKLYGGNASFIREKGVDITGEVEELAKELSSDGKTLLYFASDTKLLGIIAVMDTVRNDSKSAIEQFRQLGIKTVMLTGDNLLTAESIAKTAGVDDVVAGVLPDGKAKVIEQLKEQGKVAMIGDGINDAPALTIADVGIAIGAGTDVAIDAADVVLMKSNLSDAVAAIRLSKRTYVNIVENLFWALIYNVLLIPTAAGAYVHFGITMNPMLGAAAMSLSSFCVVMNALRLNLVNIYGGSKHEDEKTHTPDDLANEKTNSKTVIEKEETKMTKTMSIEGMMCGHCEARVKKALEAVAGVKSADVSHEKGTAVLELDDNVTDDVLTAAVTEQDYKVTGIK